MLSRINALKAILALFILPTLLLAQEQPDQATSLLVAYFDNLVSQNIIAVDHLKHIHEHEELTNPLTEADALTSSTHYVYWKQLEQLINQLKSHHCIDKKSIKLWAEHKIAEVENQAATQELVREKTANIYQPLRFVGLPEGMYTSQLDQAEFVIESGVEIQETPVTQHQWATIMSDNPAYFFYGFDSEEIEIHGKKIKLVAHNPVESVSYSQVRQFINKLNEQDTEYTYDLPSIQEYEALLQISLGNDWLHYLPAFTSTEHTQPVIAKACALDNHHRLGSLVGNVWQFTRDMANLSHDTERHLVFGGSYATVLDSIKDINSLLRPLFWNSISTGVGFRLARYKKSAEAKEAKTYHDIKWDKQIAHQDPSWYWHTNDIFEGPLCYAEMASFMLINKQHYPEATQRTLNALEENVDNFYSEIQELPEIFLSKKQIDDLTPLRGLVALERLFLDTNQINDISALSKLINLKGLDLSSNQIENTKPIGNLPSLQWVNLAHNRIRHIKALSGLINLKKLNLSQNYISDISFLEKLPNLSQLYLNINALKDLTPLKNLTNLNVLYLTNNDIDDISPLRNLINLKGLALFDNQIQDITPLENMKNLEWLHLNGNPIDDIAPLTELTNLRHIYLDKKQIKKFNAHHFFRNINPDIDVHEV